MVLYKSDYYYYYYLLAGYAPPPTSSDPRPPSPAMTTHSARQWQFNLYSLLSVLSLIPSTQWQSCCSQSYFGPSSQNTAKLLLAGLIHIVYTFISMSNRDRIVLELLFSPDADVPTGDLPVSSSSGGLGKSLSVPSAFCCVTSARQTRNKYIPWTDEWWWTCYRDSK